MPRNTTAVAAIRKRLLSVRPVSRLTVPNSAPDFIAGARHANSASALPVAPTISARMKTPRVGSTAKAWTEVRMPERTRKVPISDSEKVRMPSSTVQLTSAPRRSRTSAEWSSAVPISHGISEAFSTGSQNHQPPQPSS